MAIRLLFSQHARNRMLQWNLDVADISAVVSASETIEEYDDGAKLILGRSGVRPLHVVIRNEHNVVFVITVYEPDPERWGPTFRTRGGGES